MINWKYRIRLIWATIVFSLGVTSYLMIYGTGDSLLHSTLVTNLLIQAGAVIGGYVFGVVTDNFINGKGLSTDNDTAVPNSAVGVDNVFGRWNSRRKLMFLVLLWCAATIIYLGVFADDTPLNNNIANGVIFLNGGIVISYLFGVVFETKSITSSLVK